MKIGKHIDALRNSLYTTGYQIDKIHSKLPKTQCKDIFVEMIASYKKLIHSFMELEEHIDCEDENMRKN